MNEASRSHNAIDIDAVLAEIDHVRADQAKDDLIGASISGDREAMQVALAALAGMVPGGVSFPVLVAFVRHLLTLAGEQGHVGATEAALARERLDACAPQDLEELAVKLAQLVYGRPGGSVH